MANRTHGTLPSDIEKNPRKHVLAIEALNCVIIVAPSIKHTSPIWAYVSPILFSQGLRRHHEEEWVWGIIKKSEV